MMAKLCSLTQTNEMIYNFQLNIFAFIFLIGKLKEAQKQIEKYKGKICLSQKKSKSFA